MARRRTRELGEEGQVEYRKVRTEPMTASNTGWNLCFVTIVLVLDVFTGAHSSENVLGVALSARLEGRCLQRPGRHTCLRNKRKRRLQPLAGQRSKIEDEDEFEYEDDRNKAGAAKGSSSTMTALHILIRYARERDPAGTKLNSTVTRSVWERARRISSVSVNL